MKKVRIINVIGQSLNLWSRVMKKEHYKGFDFIRGYSCLAVVLWHSCGLTFLVDSSILILKNLGNAIYYNVCLLAVPMFFQISLFLIYSQQREFSYILGKRIPRLLKIYLFWNVVGTIIIYLTQREVDLSFSLHVKSLLLWFVKGGVRPELYFLVSLIIITILATFNQYFFKISKKSISLQLILLLISSLALYKYQFKFWSPLNFIPYTFSSLIVFELTKKVNPLTTKNSKKLFFFILLTFIFTTIVEWLFMQDIHSKIVFPPYSRMSLVIGSSAILYAILAINHLPNGFIALVSQYSLGIYCIHYNLICPNDYFGKIWSHVLPNQLALIGNTLTFCMVTIVSIILVKLIRNNKILAEFT
jgi:surface polysaccharide O-acyltransferase-like enzyme